MTQRIQYFGFRHDKTSEATSADRGEHNSTSSSAARGASGQPYRPTPLPVSESAVPQADGDA
jgi:hypothetical protein